MASGFETRLNRLAVVDYNVTLGGVRAAGYPARTTLGPVQEGRGDMDVRGVGSVPGNVPIRPTTSPPVTRETSVAKPQFPRDELQISSAGKMLDQLSNNSDVRQERLAQIKAAIENGTYDTDEKLDAALGKMFDTMGVDFDDA